MHHQEHGKQNKAMKQSIKCQLKLQNLQILCQCTFNSRQHIHVAPGGYEGMQSKALTKRHNTINTAYGHYDNSRRGFCKGIGLSQEEHSYCQHRAWVSNGH